MNTEFKPAIKEKVSQPVPLENQAKEKGKNVNASRLWVGNMDSQINEYNLLQILKQFGEIKELDYLYHKTGPQQGQSRGFSFVTYTKSENALTAMNKLNGKKVFTKKLYVRWAHEQEKILYSKPTPLNLNLKSDLVVDAPQHAKHKKDAPQLSAIQSIEQKLQEMEKSSQSNTATDTNLHPLLQQSKANKAALDAKKRLHSEHPYKKHRKRNR